MNHTTFLTFFLPVGGHDETSMVRNKKKKMTETNKPFIS